MKVEPWRVRFVDETIQARYAKFRVIMGDPECCVIDDVSRTLRIKWAPDVPGLALRLDITAEAAMYKLIDEDTARRLLERVHPDTSHLSDAYAFLASTEPLRVCV